MKNWFNNLRDPLNVIALATLIVTSLSVSAGARFLENIQSVVEESACAVEGTIQETSGANSNKNLDCKNNSIISVTHK